MPNYNLTGQKIKDTYSQLTQVSASTLVNGLGVAAPITTASITNFPTEVSRSAAAAGFGAGTGGGVSEATFTAYTASNDLKVSSLTSATSSYALKTAISGAFTLPSGVVSSSAQINLAQAAGTASWASNSITASYALNSSTSAGLVNGAGLNSLQSAANLTSVPATASGQESIAMGRSARAVQTSSISIGYGANSGIPFGVETNNYFGIAIGYTATSRGANGVAIGTTANSGRSGGIAIGNSAGTSNQNDGIISIGDNSTINDSYAVAIGANSVAGYQAAALGYNGSSTGGYSVALGAGSSATQNYAVALGANVTAAVQDYTTTKYLQLINVSSSMGQYGYADDSAAGTAGVPLGGVYHTSGSLKIRMV